MKQQDPDLVNFIEEEKEIISIDPFRCKLWKYHNRDLAWFSTKYSEDLIDSIYHHGQIDPVLVRKNIGDPQYDFEIIYGARRWYACLQIPDQKLLAKVTNADDKTCMVIMHAENVNSKDISDFERAFSFAEHMKSGLFKNQGELADAMGLSQSTISKMIQAAEIFEYEWLRRLFQNMLEIPIKSAYGLSAILKKADLYDLVQTEAKMIYKEMEKTGCFYKATVVLQRLANLAKIKIQSERESIILMVENQPIVSCYRNKQGKLFIIIENEAKSLESNKLAEACLKAIQDHFIL